MSVDCAIFWSGHSQVIRLGNDPPTGIPVIDIQTVSPTSKTVFGVVQPSAYVVSMGSAARGVNIGPTFVGAEAARFSPPVLTGADIFWLDVALFRFSPLLLEADTEVLK
jgi:hypothetical protein